MPSSLTSDLKILTSSPQVRPHYVSVDEWVTTPLSLDFNALKNRIAADPLYFGEPHHIRLRNPGHFAVNRKIHLPPKNVVAPDKWYAVACGTRVGVFLTW